METTTDMSKFGWREREIAQRLLKASIDDGFPDGFYDDEITIMFNMHSGCVFFTNSEYQAAMMNGDKLEIWHNCPQCGHEGFAEDMLHGEGDHECQRFLSESGIITNCQSCNDSTKEGIAPMCLRDSLIPLPRWTEGFTQEEENILWAATWYELDGWLIGVDAQELGDMCWDSDLLDSGVDSKTCSVQKIDDCLKRGNEVDGFYHA